MIAYRGSLEARRVNMRAKLYPHRETRPNGFDHTTCTQCGARFAVVHG